MNNNELFVKSTNEILRFDFLNVFQASEIISTALKQVDKVMEDQATFLVERELGFSPSDDEVFADTLESVMDSGKYDPKIHFFPTDNGFDYFLFIFEGTELIHANVVRVIFDGDNCSIANGIIDIEAAKVHVEKLLKLLN